MERLISVLKGCKKHREIILDIFFGVFNAKNQPKIRRPSPSVTLRAKKTSLQRDLLMAVPVKNSSL